MYYIIMRNDSKQLIQFRDIDDRKSTKWEHSFPRWDETSYMYFGRSADSINWSLYTILVTSESPITLQTHPEFNL